MKKLVVAIGIAASAISVSGFAQGAHGGFMMKDETRQEALQRADRMFDMLDADHRGVVTRTDAQAAAAQFAASHGGDDGAHEGRMQHMIDTMFGSSQSLTRQQFEAQALARFDAMDLNHDGVVTAAERQQAREQHRETQSQSPHP